MSPVDFPRLAGTYAMLMRLDQTHTLQVGKLGTFTFATGLYVYIGSAHGPGGLHARLNRHLRANKKQHWHIDYLTRCAPSQAIWWHAAPERLECVWARQLAALPGMSAPVQGFGSSDCTCESHLFALAPESIRAAYEALDKPGIQWVHPVENQLATTIFPGQQIDH